MARKKDPGGPKRPAPRTAWKPGVSPNPGGRPRGFAEVKRLALEAAPGAIAKMIQLMVHGRDQRVQLEAAKALLDRGIGKPATVFAGEGGEGPVQLQQVAESDLRATLEKIEKSVRAAEAGTPGPTTPTEGGA